MRRLVASGYLGGDPGAHGELLLLRPGRPSYARALLGDRRHWVRRLPGRLLQNIISHGIARIAEFLTGDAPEVIAHGFVSPLLRRLGESEIVDELRVIIGEGAHDGLLHVLVADASLAPPVSGLRPKERSRAGPGSGDADQAAGSELQELRGEVRAAGDTWITVSREFEPRT